VVNSAVWDLGALALAPSLLGWELSDGEVTIRLTEVEAYDGVGVDPASHAYRGRTPRNAAMFGPPGHAYVYFVFGMHWCVNVVCGPAGSAAAVLLRAGEVTSGIEVARRRRAGAAASPARASTGTPTGDRDLARGPARLAQALGVTGLLDGSYLLDGSGALTLRPPGRGVRTATAQSSSSPGSSARGEVCRGPRVGVANGADLPWRFWLAGEPTVSPYRPHVTRQRGIQHRQRRT
jgi:DNA-3-methyladenine glycosylase